MNGVDYRFEVQAALHPDHREGVAGGGSSQLVTLGLCHAPGAVDASTGEPASTPDVLCDLRPSDARLLADRLPDCAARAEVLRQKTDR